MIAAYVWTNNQIFNVTNAKLNLYPNEKADLYVYMGNSLSEELIEAVKASGVFEHIFCFDPVTINRKHLRGGRTKLWVLHMKSAYMDAYRLLLDNCAPGVKYDRVMVGYLHAHSMYFIQVWTERNRKLKISLVDEGTANHYFDKKHFAHPLFMVNNRKGMLRSLLLEYSLCSRAIRKVDELCLYRADANKTELPWPKRSLPPVNEARNPVMWKILKDVSLTLPEHKVETYQERDFIYFSSYSPEGRSFDMRSLVILQSLLNEAGKKHVLLKVHVHSSAHGKHFGKSYEDRIPVDRDRYYFESLFSALEHPEKKVFLSNISSAMMNMKFIFDCEPYLIFTYRLYDTYKQIGCEADDLLSAEIKSTFTHPERVMIPNSRYELKLMLRKLRLEICGTPVEADEDNEPLTDEDVLAEMAEDENTERDCKEQEDDQSGEEKECEA